MKKFLIIPVTAACLAFSSCNLLANLGDQLSSLANLANCEYSLKNVSNVTVAGVNVKQVTNGNISATDVVKLAAAITTKKVPLDLDVNINVKNPTTTKAALSTMDWKLLIENAQFATGSTKSAYTINPSTTSVVPLGVNTDIFSIFSSEGISKIKNFASSFSSDGTSSKVGLQIKPSLTVGTTVIPAPNYITLSKTTGTATQKS